MTLKNFARRGLLLQRFLEFLEQPDVLDGDHRLVGEGFKQLDLRRGEGAYLGATRVQCPMSSSCWRSGTAKKVRNAAVRTQRWEIFSCAAGSGM